MSIRLPVGFFKMMVWSQSMSVTRYIDLYTKDHCLQKRNSLNDKNKVIEMNVISRHKDMKEGQTVKIGQRYFEKWLKTLYTV